jgi:hypothetical protein
MFVLRGFLYCLGRKDIDKDEITKNVNLSLDKGSIWRDCKIISYTKDLNPSFIIKDEELIFNYDLLKNDDYLYFEALGESKDDNYTVSHRIANVPTIQKESLQTFRSIGTSIFLGIIMLILSIVVIFTLLKPFDIDRWEFDKTYFDKNGNIVPYDTVRSHTNFSLVTYEEKFEKDSLNKVFNKLNLLFGKRSKTFSLVDGYGVKYEYDETGVLYLAYGLSLFSLLMGVYLLFTSVRFYTKRKEIYKKLISEMKRLEGK